jgi:FkbM family methyltransferase
MFIKLTKRFIQHGLNRVGYEVRRFAPPAPDALKPYTWLRNLKIRSVIDVGANVGEFSSLMLQLFPECRVVAFEPLEECAERLRTRLRSVAGSRGCVVQKACGDKNGQAILHASSHTHISSLYDIAPINFRFWPRIEGSFRQVSVPLVTLDSETATMTLADPLLTKIDVEGFTKPVLTGGRATVGRSEVVVIECSFVELYKGQVLFDWVHDFMRELGFRYAGNLDQQLDPLDGSVLQCDAVFLAGNARKANVKRPPQ